MTTPDSRHLICGRFPVVICLLIWRIADKRGRFHLRIWTVLQDLLGRWTTIYHPICVTTPCDHRHHALIDICHHISRGSRTMKQARGLIGGLVEIKNRMLTEYD
jgi:hypothetical protein